MNIKPPRVLSLFSGAGGLDLGFHKEEFEIVACIEWEKSACDTITANLGKYFDKKTKVICKDVTTISPLELKEEIGEIDFMIGGPPCQSFSAAGRRAGGVYGVNDKRGSLFWWYAEMIKHFQPNGFLFENVKGILQANKKGDWEIIKQLFQGLGYYLTYSVLDAADYGTPQHRERLILVGLKDKNVKFKFPRPTHGPNSICQKSYVTTQEAFADIDDPNEIVPEYTGKYGKLIKEIPPGFNYLHFTERMGHPKPLFAWRSRFSGFLYKLNPSEPSKTLVAQQGKYDGPFHWKNRKLNIDELIRIQGFPKDYKFVGSKASIQMQIGNAVAPNMGHYLAKAVKKQVFGFDTEVILLAHEEILKRRLTERVKKNKPKQKLKPDSKGQMLLFKRNFKWKTSTRKLNIPSNSVHASCSLNKGQLVILGETVNSSQNIQITIRLNFNEPVACAFEDITCKIYINECWDFYHAWDCIHAAVNQYTSYEDLSPLYGNFTEPYPKFKSAISVEGIDSRINKLLSWMVDYNNLSVNHEAEVLESKFDTKCNLSQIAELLRTKRVDIRTNETNRTIPKNCFKICYPFTIPSWQSSFVRWVKLGHHENADLEINTLLEQNAK